MTVNLADILKDIDIVQIQGTAEHQPVGNHF